MTRATKVKTSFNKSHPETAEGEVFLTNIPTINNRASLMIGNRGNRSDWESIGWRTKRMGSVAYDIDGNVISELRPVFVQRAELQERYGVNPDKLGG